MTMKLQKLHIENFRSLRDATWEPGDLNVLIGPNAGGKSNLLMTIDLLAAAADGRLRDHVTRQGGIGSLVWNWGQMYTLRRISASVWPINPEQGSAGGLGFLGAKARVG